MKLNAPSRHAISVMGLIFAVILGVCLGLINNKRIEERTRTTQINREHTIIDSMNAEYAKDTKGCPQYITNDMMGDTEQLRITPKHIFSRGPKHNPRYKDFNYIPTNTTELPDAKDYAQLDTFKPISLAFTTSSEPYKLVAYLKTSGVYVWDGDDNKKVAEIDTCGVIKVYDSLATIRILLHSELQRFGSTIQ